MEKSGNLGCRTVLREKMLLVLGLGNNQLLVVRHLDLKAETVEAVIRVSRASSLSTPVI